MISANTRICLGFGELLHNQRSGPAAVAQFVVSGASWKGRIVAAAAKSGRFEIGAVKSGQKFGTGMPSGIRARLGRIFSSSSGATGDAIGDNRVAGLSIDEDAKEQSRVEGMTTSMYLSHGSPMLSLETDEPANKFLQQLSKQIERPKAILMISAHWDTAEPTVNAMQTNETIHDFYGFPRELYSLRYDAPGNPALSERVVELLKQGGFAKAKTDERRGLDHGAWTPLLLMYPDRDIPVVQLSLQSRKGEAHHYKLGQALAPLKDEGVLIIGSGSATHNFGALNLDGGPVAPWALAFDNWLNDAMVNNKHEDVVNYLEKAPYGRKAHPTPDHFLPAIVALGAAGENSVGKRIHTSWCLGSMSMASFSFGNPSPAAATA